MQKLYATILIGSIFLSILGSFNFIFTANASSVDTGWIGAGSFVGNTDIKCGKKLAIVYGQGNRKFYIPESVLRLPEGNYLIDIVAHYGFYDGTGPQTNETMTVRTSVDFRNISDLNGSGGRRKDRDNCEQIQKDIKTYTNIAGTPVKYAGGAIYFEPQSRDSQSIEIYKVRVYRIFDDPTPTPTPTPGKRYAYLKIVSLENEAIIFSCENDGIYKEVLTFDEQPIPGKDKVIGIFDSPEEAWTKVENFKEKKSILKNLWGT